MLKDSSGRKVSSFIKGIVGAVGDIIRLKAKVAIKGKYVNLTRVKIVPRPTKAPLQPAQQVTKPVAQPIQQPTNNLPVQPSGSQPVPGTPHASNYNWYRLSKQAGMFDKLNPKNWIKHYNKPENNQNVQQVEDESEITDLTQPDPSNPPNQQPANQVQVPKYKTHNQVDLNKAYDMFADSYQKATGKAWGKSKFLGRAEGWHFFGEDAGYIAVRPQRSGLYKLVGIAGDDSNPTAKGRALIKAFKDLMAEGKPTWGMVSQDLKGMAERMGMKSPTPMFIKTFIKFIPSETFGGAKLKQVLPDGGVEFEYSDVGSATKYFIANDQYFQWLKQNVDTNPNIPKPAKFLLKKLLDKMAASRAFVKFAMVDSFDHVCNYIDISEV